MAFERIRTRRDTTAVWAMTNPVLGLGELGIDVTLQKVKAGDGLRPWNELPFLSETEIVNTLDSARTDAALSAAQGKALNQALGAVTQNLNGLQGAVAGKLNKGDVLNTLNSARTDAALSAAMGKVLNAQKADKNLLLQRHLGWYVKVGATNTDNEADGTTAKPFKTIQGAINRWMEEYRFSDLLLVLCPGTYRENVVISGNGVYGSLSIGTLDVVPFNSINSPFPSPHTVIWEPVNINAPCLHIKENMSLQMLNVCDIHFQSESTASSAIKNSSRASFNWLHRLLIENFREGIGAYSSLTSIYQTLIKSCDLGVQAWDTGILRFCGSKISGVKIGVDNPSCFVVFDGYTIVEAASAKIVNRLGGQAFGQIL